MSNEMPVSARRRGPRGDRGAIRERILTVAREEFISNGYDGTTMRSIAKKATCDAAMPSYYFESKQRLFRSCFNLPLDPASEVLALLAQGTAGAGERMVRFGVELCEEHLTSDTMHALMRALITDAATSQRFRDYVRHDVFQPIDDLISIDDKAAAQIELSMSMLYGTAIMRYVVRMEPLASLPAEQLIAELAPIVQARIDAVAG